MATTRQHRARNSEVRPNGRAEPTSATAARDVVIFFRQLRQRMRDVPSGGLTPSQVSVLLRLDRDGASSTTLLATAEGVRSQSMTATLNVLELRGLVERRPDPGDGRRYIVTLSAAGRANVRDGRELRLSWLARTMEEHLSPDQIASLGTCMKVLADAIAG